jgi:hypothetical protein
MKDDLMATKLVFFFLLGHLVAIKLFHVKTERDDLVATKSPTEEKKKKIK